MNISNSQATRLPIGMPAFPSIQGISKPEAIGEVPIEIPMEYLQNNKKWDISSENELPYEY